MQKPKFKIGDKVKVLRASTLEEYNLWRDIWESEMNEVIGRVAVIESVSFSCDDCDYHKYMLSITHYYFPEFVLQNEIQVGQQLLFDFMTP